MEDTYPETPLVIVERDSKSPLLVAISSPESNGMRSPSQESPDSHCVICLGTLRNKSFTDSCLHQFCFECLLQWSKVKAECPLCKQPFKSIIHNVRSNLDYDQYHIERQEPDYIVSDIVHSFNLDLEALDRRFRCRSNMARHYFRELAQNFITRSGILPENNFEIPPLVPLDLSAPANGRYTNHLRSATQYRGRQRGTSDFRRNVYLQDLWVRDLADVSGRYRECTPQFYRENPAQIHRIIPWLNREVNVLLSHCESHAAYVLSQIEASLTLHPIRSREFQELVRPYFGDRTEHFIHEFYTFAHSVYDITGFDQHAVYGPNPNYATEVQEVSSSNDSDIEILESIEVEKKSQKSLRRGFKKNLLKRVGSAKVEEPVAGPSGLASAGTSDSVKVSESDVEEIKILDYVKPEPKVITLSSGDESTVLSTIDLISDVKPKIDKLPQNSSDDESSSYESRRSRRRSRKGKCKADGFGLKGRQKRKYIKCLRESSSTSTTSSSSSCSRDGRGRISKNKRSRSISSVSSVSSDCKRSGKTKKKNSKVPHKKCKKNAKNKCIHSQKQKLSDNEKTPVQRKKVKSYVIVPYSRSENSRSKEKYKSEPLTSYWSILPNPAATKCWKKKDSSRNYSKRNFRNSSDDEKSKKRMRDFSFERSRSSFDVNYACKRNNSKRSETDHSYSPSIVGNTYSENSSSSGSEIVTTSRLTSSKRQYSDSSNFNSDQSH